MLLVGRGHDRQPTEAPQGEAGRWKQKRRDRLASPHKRNPERGARSVSNSSMTVMSRVLSPCPGRIGATDETRDNPFGFRLATADEGSALSTPRWTQWLPSPFNKGVHARESALGSLSGPIQQRFTADSSPISGHIWFMEPRPRGPTILSPASRSVAGIEASPDGDILCQP
jgi:hypothetical protein